MKFSIFAIATLVAYVIAAPVADVNAALEARTSKNTNKCDTYKISWETCKKNEYDYEHQYTSCKKEYNDGKYDDENKKCYKEMYDGKYGYEQCKKKWGLLGLVKCKVEEMLQKKVELKCKLVYLKAEKLAKKCDLLNKSWSDYKKQCPIKEHEYKSCKP